MQDDKARFEPMTEAQKERILKAAREGKLPFFTSVGYLNLGVLGSGLSEEECRNSKWYKEHAVWPARPEVLL